MADQTKTHGLSVHVDRRIVLVGGVEDHLRLYTCESHLPGMTMVIVPQCFEQHLCTENELYKPGLFYVKG